MMMDFDGMMFRTDESGPSYPPGGMELSVEDVRTQHQLTEVVHAEGQFIAWVYIHGTLGWPNPAVMGQPYQLWLLITNWNSVAPIADDDIFVTFFATWFDYGYNVHSSAEHHEVYLDDWN